MEQGSAAPKKKKAKARLAVVRKGCVKGRERTSEKDKRKPGRSCNPDSKTAKLKAVRAETATYKLLDKLQLPSCIWSESRQGGKRKDNLEFTCCANKDCYRKYRQAAGGKHELASTISTLRKYYHSLDYDNRRQWWADREIFDGYNTNNPIRRHSRLSTFFCEPHSELKRKLAETQGNEILKPVNQHTCVHVCSKFMQFICGGNHNTKDQNAIRKHAFSSPTGASPEDLDANLGSVRSPYERKTGSFAGQTAVNIRSWLHEEGQLAIVDPADDFSVLPYRTCQSTHAHYVAEREEQAGVEWVRNTEQRLARAWEEDNKIFEDGVEREIERRVAEKMAEERKNSEGKEECKCGQPVELPPGLGGDESDDGFNIRRRLSSDEEKNTDEEDELMYERKRAKVKYRYGNKELGPVDPNMPEIEGIAALSTFNAIWRSDDHLRKIICREHLPFAKCDTCIRHRQKAERKRTKIMIDEDRKALRQHLEEVKHEKIYYYHNRDCGRRNKSRILSIITDGADQSKYGFPHFKDKSHMSDEVPKIKMHLYGALVHGHGAYAFTMADHEKQGHNTTIQVLQEIFLDFKKKGKALPPVLKLQLDNTTKTNKGQFLYGYLAMLVEYGVFQEIEVSFLPVGHTHEDIDQFFSRIAVYLRHHDTFSRAQLSEAIKRAYIFADTGEPPTVVHWDTLANVSKYLKEYTNNFSKNCMSFRHARFFRSVEQKVWLQVTTKMNSWGDPLDTWRGLENHTTHTLPFSTSYGVPNFYKAYSMKNVLPKAARREQSGQNTPAAIAKQKDQLTTLHRYFDSFTREHLDDLLSLLDLAAAAPTLWPWKQEDVELIFGKYPGQGAVQHVQAQVNTCHPQSLYTAYHNQII